MLKWSTPGGGGYFGIPVRWAVAHARFEHVALSEFLYTNDGYTNDGYTNETISVSFSQR